MPFQKRPVLNMDNHGPATNQETDDSGQQVSSALLAVHIVKPVGCCCCGCRFDDHTRPVDTAVPLGPDVGCFTESPCVPQAKYRGGACHAIFCCLPSDLAFERNRSRVLALFSLSKMVFPYLFALAWLVYPDCAKLTVVNPVFEPLSDLLADSGVLEAATLNCSGVDLNRMLFFPPTRQVDNFALAAITLPALTELMFNSYQNAMAAPMWALSAVLGCAQAANSIDRLAFCKRSCLNADKTSFEPRDLQHLRSNLTVPVASTTRIAIIVDHLRKAEFATACTALSAMQPTSNMASDWVVQSQFCMQQVGRPRHFD